MPTSADWSECSKSAAHPTGAGTTLRFDFPAWQVSLDLAQWFTEPEWRGLTQQTQQTLLDDGVPFFEKILREHPNIELLLANGMTVVSAFKQRLSAQIVELAPLTVPGYDQPMRVFCGKALDRRLIGWNGSLSQERRSGMLAALATRVGQIAAYWDGCP